MSLLLRWCKFNFVGGMGMLLQLTALTYLNRWMRGHYLVATIVAVELAVVHNFFWHLRYTWSDRGGGGALLPFVRFHLANGLVSLLGNVALMPLLFRAIGLPLLLSNSIAILCCSIVNFSLSHRWAFQAGGKLAIGGAIQKSSFRG